MNAPLSAMITLLLDPGSELWSVVLLSLKVSLSATVLAALVALPLGALLAISRFPGRQALVVLFNAFMGLPPVVVGLAVYLLLSRAGPLGHWGLLFTPGAMVIAQALLIAPIIIALTRQVIEDGWNEYSETLRSMGATRWQAARTLLRDLRWSLLTVLLAGFGRAIAEVGAVMVVGGNIAGVTRVMTTTIALETTKGDLPLALALGLLLIVLTVIVNALVQVIRDWAARHEGAWP